MDILSFRFDGKLCDESAVAINSEDIRKHLKFRIADVQDTREKIVGVEEAVEVMEQLLINNAEIEKQRIIDVFREVIFCVDARNPIFIFGCT